MYKTVNGRRIKYRYAQNGWKDQLTELLFSINGKEKTERFEYDALGNPTLYRGQQMTWQGRRLKSYDTVDGLIEYAYDVNGIRTSKTRNGVTYNFIYDGNNLVAEQRTNGSESYTLYYLYGIDGIAGFRYNEQTYLYRKNVQGDVTHIYTEDGEQVGHYIYDAWGNAQILQDKNGIAELNPFRYRSYYYDEETGFYYLQTRYYDSELGRFISADSIEYLDPETLGGLNLYVYCNNNPVNYSDEFGTWEIPNWLRIAVGVAAIALAIGISIATAGTAAPVLIGIAVGAVVSGGLNLVSQLKSDDPFNAEEFLWATFGGAVSGAVSAIPLFGGFSVTNYIGTAILGGIASVAGGFVSGSVTDWTSAGIAFGVGAFANVVAKGVQHLHITIKTNSVMNIKSNGVRSSKINKFLIKNKVHMEGIHKGLGNWSKNLFKNMTKATFRDIVRHSISRSAMVYSAIVSSLMSGWY